MTPKKTPRTPNKTASAVAMAVTWLAIAGALAGVLLTQFAGAGVRLPAVGVAILSALVVWGRRAIGLLQTPHAMETKTALIAVAIALAGAIPTPPADSVIPDDPPAKSTDVRDVIDRKDAPDVPLSSTFPPFAGLALLVPVLDLSWKRRRSSFVRRLRQAVAGRGRVAVAVAIAVAIIAVGCARLPDQVRKDSVSASDLYMGYVAGDPALKQETKDDRIRLAVQWTEVGTSGWASWSYKDVATTITCQLERYVKADATLAADVRDGVLKMTRSIRVGVDVPPDCPPAGGAK